MPFCVCGQVKSASAQVLSERWTFHFTAHPVDKEAKRVSHAAYCMVCLWRHPRNVCISMTISYLSSNKLWDLLLLYRVMDPSSQDPPRNAALNKSLIWRTAAGSGNWLCRWIKTPPDPESLALEDSAEQHALGAAPTEGSNLWVRPMINSLSRKQEILWINKIGLGQWCQT